MSAIISTPHVGLVFFDEDLASATQKWHDWVRRDATLVSRKDQAQDSSGVPLELLWLSVRLRPALVPEVAIAELRLATAEQNPQRLPLQFQPCLPWPWPQWLAAEVHAGDPDSLWVVPRILTDADFHAAAERSAQLRQAANAAQYGATDARSGAPG